MFHFLGEQRRAIYLDQAQHPMGGMQLVCALLEQDPLVRALGVAFQRGTGVVQRRRELFGDDMQGLGTDVGHTGIVFGVSR